MASQADKMMGVELGKGDYLVTTLGSGTTVPTTLPALQVEYADDMTTPVYSIAFSNYNAIDLAETTVQKWYVNGICPADGKHTKTSTKTFDLATGILLTSRGVWT